MIACENIETEVKFQHAFIGGFISNKEGNYYYLASFNWVKPPNHHHYTMIKGNEAVKGFILEK